MQPYEIQRSEAWFQFRKKMITATDSCVIMGVSPWKTLLELYHEKISDVLPDKSTETFAMRRGTELEPLALQVFENQTGYLMMPSVVVHPTIPYMMASLDGLELEKTVALEIKAPGRADHDLALKGIVPEKYIPQLQHTMEVCQLEEIYYMSYISDSDYTIFKVNKDDDYTAKLITAELEFWKRIQDRNPPEPTDRDSEEIKSADWVHCCDQYAVQHLLSKELESQLAEIECEKERIKNELIHLANNKSAFGAGLKLSKSVRRGHIDYARVPALQGLDLEPYRKESTETWRISLKEAV